MNTQDITNLRNVIKNKIATYQRLVVTTDKSSARIAGAIVALEDLLAMYPEPKPLSELLKDE